MASASITVLVRCAMISVVLPALAASIARRTPRSLARSNALVASSSNRTDGFIRIARAIAMRCFWPPDSATPRSPQRVW
eukprot:31490-Pelagococcus_subviridis.AAC.11